MNAFSRAAVVTVALLGAPPTAIAGDCFTAILDGAQAGTGSGGTGLGLFTLNDSETILTYNITLSGVPETAAHIHSEAEGNGIVKDLDVGNPKINRWGVQEVSPLTAQRVQDLKDGKLYVNIHSIAFPGGEIRGQILPVVCEETCFETEIDGGQSGTGSPAIGMGSFTLNHSQTRVDYTLSFSGVTSGQTGAHIHSDAEAGNVVENIGVGNPKTGAWSWNESLPMTAARVVALKQGDLYVNIHSNDFPGGEIRGQIWPCDASAVGPAPSARATALEQNVPNPFNPTTRIAFTLTRAAHTRIDVFDAGGRHISTLVDRVVAEGRSVVEWNGRSTDGGAVASGVYFYRLIAGEVIATRKMVLLK